MKHVRKPGHSYDASKPVSWPEIILRDPGKYGWFMTQIALKKRKEKQTWKHN